MKYRYEYNGNPDYVTLHLTNKLIDESFVNEFISMSEYTMELFSLLKGCVGVTEINIRPYSVTAKRGAAFERDKVLDSLLSTVKAWLSLKEGIQDQFHREMHDELRGSFDRMFGHNARKMLALFEEIRDENKALEDQVINERGCSRETARVHLRPTPR